ncbi:MAG: hypothetical protein OXR84_06570 [Magnetovibrio sp.]|nr:hypothetical protein [Magnetovibrio sp.]
MMKCSNSPPRWHAICFGCLVAVLLTAAGPRALAAAELLMFESPICEWCEVWDEELGAVYAKTPEGRRAPLRRVDIYDPLPADLKDLKPVRFTPTFVLMDRGREVGRILGYPGEDFFWSQLDILLKRAASAYACGPKAKETKTC